MESRPEHFELGDGGLDAEVVVVEPTGSETQMVARFEGHEIIAVFRQRQTIRPGDRIPLGRVPTWRTCSPRRQANGSSKVPRPHIQWSGRPQAPQERRSKYNGWTPMDQKPTRWIAARY